MWSESPGRVAVDVWPPGWFVSGSGYSCLWWKPDSKSSRNGFGSCQGGWTCNGLRLCNWDKWNEWNDGMLGWWLKLGMKQAVEHRWHKDSEIWLINLRLCSCHKSVCFAAGSNRLVTLLVVSWWLVIWYWLPLSLTVHCHQPCCVVSFVRSCMGTSDANFLDGVRRDFAWEK